MKSLRLSTNVDATPCVDTKISITTLCLLLAALLLAASSTVPAQQQASDTTCLPVLVNIHGIKNDDHLDDIKKRVKGNLEDANKILAKSGKKLGASNKLKLCPIVFKSHPKGPAKVTKGSKQFKKMKKAALKELDSVFNKEKKLGKNKGIKVQIVKILRHSDGTSPAGLGSTPGRIIWFPDGDPDSLKENESRQTLSQRTVKVGKFGDKKNPERVVTIYDFGHFFIHELLHNGGLKEHKDGTVFADTLDTAEQAETKGHRKITRDQWKKLVDLFKLHGVKESVLKSAGSSSGGGNSQQQQQQQQQESDHAEFSTFPTEEISLGGVAVDDDNRQPINTEATPNPTHEIEVIAGNPPQDSAPLAIGDFNNDNRFDIAAAQAGTITIFHSTHDDLLQPVQRIDDIGLGNDILVRDVNGDQVSDIVVFNANSNNRVAFLGTGDGTFSIGRRVAVRKAQSRASADVNGDDLPDQIKLNQLEDRVTVTLGDAAGELSLSQELTTGSKPDAVVVADVNGDDLSDLVVNNPGSGDISVFPGYGDGTFGVEQIYPIGDLWK